MHTIITGTTQGLGKQLLALHDGAATIVINRRPTEAEKEIICELSDKSAVDQAISELKAQIDDKEVMFILNAGTYGEDETVLDVEPVSLGKLVYANVFSQLSIVESLLKDGVAVKLIAISSGMGSIAQAPEPYHFAYSVSKSALNLSIRLLSKTYQNLSYVIFDPGWMQTRMGGNEATEDPVHVAQNIMKAVAVPGNWNRSDGMIEANTGETISW